MPTLARLLIEDAYLPLQPDCRAMLIKSLKEIIADLGPHGRMPAPAVIYIDAPRIRTAHPKTKLAPIKSENCGPDAVGCDG